MENHIAHWSYLLGLACSLLAMVWKGLEFLKVLPDRFGSLGYMTLFKGGLLFLVIVVATSGYVAAKSQKA
ncbi:MAG: hypothetical protein LAO07_04130 [Acidobacteriia bacterium]|nr:hypothetical protein [Terriglobia bacterium]